MPEVAPAADLAVKKVTPETFWRSWREHLAILLERSHEALIAKKGGLLIGAVRIPPTIWGELSNSTKAAIWRYLRTLTLEAAMVVSLEGITPGTQQVLLDIMTDEATADPTSATPTFADPADPASMMNNLPQQLQPLMEKLKSVMGQFMDVSGFLDVSGMAMPKIPDRLRNGQIARMVEEMAKHLTPEEFGIDPAILEGDNVEEVLRRLFEAYQRNPALLTTNAKRIADKIRKQILGGSLNRDALLSEAKEYVDLFKDHPLFKEGLSKLQEMFGENGLASMFGSLGGGGNTESERCRIVQERLRKKLEARRAKK